MRAYEALHQLTERFAPMSEKSSIDLQSQSQQNYMRVLNEVEKMKTTQEEIDTIQRAIDNPNVPDKEKEKLLEQLPAQPVKKLEHKVVEFAEKWWVRYLISMLFVWIQPKIQNYLNPPPPVDIQDYEDRD